MSWNNRLALSNTSAPVAAFFFAAALLFLTAQAVTATVQLIEVTPVDKADYQHLLRSVPETRAEGLSTSGEAVRFPVEASRTEEIRALGFSVAVVIPDLAQHYAARLGTRDQDYGAYHTLDEAIAAMDALAAAHPTIMTPKQSIGQSIEGRDLWVYKISDNPGIDEDEPEVFFNSYIHAREPITVEVMIDLAEHLVTNYGSDPRVTAMVQDREIWIQPVVNPDGVEYNHLTDPEGGGMWRKNRRNNGDGTHGVDLNRNFGYQWGYDDYGSSPSPSSEVYRGTAAFSEPETAAMRDFVIDRGFSIAMNYHSYSNINLMVFGYETIHCDDYDEMFILALEHAATSNYSPGCGWEFLYSVNGDAVDWMYGDQVSKPKILAFVTEVGSSDDGFWPPESRIPALVLDNREGNLRMIELADNPYRVLAPGVAFVDDTERAVGPDFTLTWSVPAPDPDNPAVTWNLREGTGHYVGADDLEGDNQERWESFGWIYSSTRSHSASHSFYTGEDDKLNRTLTSRRGHLVAPGEDLRFWTWFNIEEDWDYGYVELTTDGRDFVTLPGTITTDYDPNDRNLGNGVTGGSGSWQQAIFDLSAYEGEVIWVRFRYNTDGYLTEEGWYVDDIEPADLFATETVVATALGNAEHTFNDHPEGTFSFLVQAVDVEDDAAVWGPPRSVEVSGPSGIAEGAPPQGAWRGLELLGSNPFAGAVPMRFALPDGLGGDERVALSIHDANGRLIKNLQAGPAGALGATQITAVWKPGELPAGLYFARLQVGRRLSHQRLILMR
ncbi:MAG: immune inhibitor A [Candidatus Eisenbacteria sp.]|nr:immune inhibitor A [Candidatus Eisenbacteria bacterium]